MKLEKRDVAEALGLVYNGTSWEYDSDGEEYEFHKFLFQGKEMLVWANRELDEAWEEASSLLLEPLVELLISKL